MAEPKGRSLTGAVFLYRSKAARRGKFGVMRRGKRVEPVSPALTFTIIAPARREKIRGEGWMRARRGLHTGGGDQEMSAFAEDLPIRLPEKEWTKSRHAKSLGSEVDGDG